MADKLGSWRDITFSARDGLRLYARHYPAPGSSLRPVLCLAGLTRNSRDFHDLAVALSTGQMPRDVYALDYRGRGQQKNKSEESEAQFAGHGVSLRAGAWP